MTKTPAAHMSGGGHFQNFYKVLKMFDFNGAGHPLLGFPRTLFLTVAEN